MSREDPLSLSDLATQSLLSNGNPTLHALEEHLVGLFPTLIMAALKRGCMKIVGEMVRAWPFPCLHLGSFITEQWKPLLEAVLDGLERVPTNTVFPGRSKLKVLDLTRDRESSPLEMFPAPPVITHMMANPQCTPSCGGHTHRDGEPLEIHADLRFCRFNGLYHPSPFTSYIVQRVNHSHGCLRLCCRALVIKDAAYHDHLQRHRLPDMRDRCLTTCEPQLSQVFSPEDQRRFLNNRDFCVDFYGCLSLLRSLGHLKELHLMFSCCSEKLRLLLSYLREPLQSLVISKCRLTMIEMPYLSASIHATCLKELELSNADLSQVVPGPLAVLLQEVSSTLQHLSLRNCKLKESHLTALLPTLCSCAHLRSLVLGGNVISTPGLVNMLQHLAELKGLKRLQYPVPADCEGTLNRGKLAQVHDTLQQLLQTLRRGDMELTNST
uniref:Uncharacterized protein n=1 Tax=Loxodonta africana TaxID=9785 RepID=G3U419_LOXAF